MESSRHASASAAVQTHDWSPTSNNSRSGRKPDASKDAAILQATVDVVGDVGYDGMTMDLVAARAGTTKSAMYRRWSSKGELTLDAVVRLQGPEVALDNLPDSGSLRGDLLALTPLYLSETGRRKLRLLAGLSSLLGRHPELVDAANAAIIEPWVDVCRLLIGRAVERGEAVTNGVETVARVIPSMTSDRVLVQRKPLDHNFFVELIDVVLLPAVGCGPHDRSPHPQEEPLPHV
jgi:AcrR family transcriptional regulator